jgi:hypothetical protein
MKQLKIFLLAALIFTVSCKVSLVPARSQDAITQVEQASTASDNLYNSIINSSDKSYDAYAANYEAVNEQITQILVLDSSRKNSKVLLIIANDLAKRFQTYQSEHKDAGSINGSQARTYKDYIHALFESLHNAEINFK